MIIFFIIYQMIRSFTVLCIELISIPPVQETKNSGGNEINSSLHDAIQSMPFKIAADCETEISTYFKPYVKLAEDSSYSSSFRGHRLRGKNLNLPKGYVGLVLHERVSPNSDDVDRNFYIKTKFNSFTYWDYDKKPTMNDAIMQMFNVWIDVAEALHSPIQER